MTLQFEDTPSITQAHSPSGLEANNNAADPIRNESSDTASTLDLTTSKPSRTMSPAESSPINTAHSLGFASSAVPSEPSPSNASPSIQYDSPLASNLQGLPTSAASSGGFTFIHSTPSSSIVEVEAETTEGGGGQGISIEVDALKHSTTRSQASASSASAPSFVSHLSFGITGASSNGSNSNDFEISRNGNGSGVLLNNGAGKASYSASSPNLASALSFHPTRTVARVYPSGTTMYPDSSIQREEYIRLVLQSLRDIGYQ